MLYADQRLIYAQHATNSYKCLIINDLQHDMLTPAQIATLLAPYKIVPRGTIQPPQKPFDAPRGTLRAPRRRNRPLPSPQNPPRGTIANPTTAISAENAPRGTIHHNPELTNTDQNAPRETIAGSPINQNAPRGTIQAPENSTNAPRGTIEPLIATQDAPRGTILPPVDWPTVHEKLAAYLELILKWNARTNLTAIRDPEQIIQRHFGESIFTGLALAEAGVVPRGTTLLDFGSGAGFPGLPIQLLYPTLHVTLSESQGKKAAFLHEAVRVLGTQTEIWSQRVETMPPDRRFDVIALRAVDNMEAAVQQAVLRASSTLAILTTSSTPHSLPSTARLTRTPLPTSADGSLLIASF